MKPRAKQSQGISLATAALFLLVYTALLVWWVSPGNSFGPSASCIQLQTKVEATSSGLQATAARLQHAPHPGGLQQPASGQRADVDIASPDTAPVVLGSSSRRALTASLEESLQQLLQGATSITILGCTGEKLGAWKGAQQLRVQVACVDTNCLQLEALAQQQQQQQQQPGAGPWSYYCISPRGGHPAPAPPAAAAAAAAGAAPGAGAAANRSRGLVQRGQPPAADTLVLMHNVGMGLPSAMLEAAAVVGRPKKRIIVAEAANGQLTKLLSQDLTTGEHVVHQKRHNKHGAAFGNIYNSASWGGEGNGSGPGSSLAATGSARQKILHVLRKYKVNRMIDSSCGGMLWMPLVIEEYRKDNPNFEYLGMDVVCPLIDKHKQTFANKTYLSFQCVDASHEPIPQGYDLILSRDSLQHLPMADAYAFLHNVVNSGAKLLLVGSYLHRERNENLDHAGKDSGSITAYAVNLLQAPFLVQPAPLESMDEEDSGPAPGTKGLLLLDVTKLNWAESLDMW